MAAHAEFFCCDGLAKANEADGALLLGMGGRTIVEILQKGRSLLPQMRGLVAGPAGHAEALYRALPALGLLGVWLAVPLAQMLTGGVSVFIRLRVDRQIMREAAAGPGCG